MGFWSGFVLSSHTLLKAFHSHWIFSSSPPSIFSLHSSTLFCLLLLLLSCFSCVRLCVTPEMAAHQAPPSLGFSRQEHWSWLPFPSPMQESEKWKWSHSVVSHSSRSHGLQPTRLLRPWDFPSKSTGVGCHCLLRPTTQMDSLPAKLPEMPHGKMVLDLTFWFDPEGHEMINLKIQTFCYQLMG